MRQLGWILANLEEALQSVECLPQNLAVMERELQSTRTSIRTNRRS